MWYIELHTYGIFHSDQPEGLFSLDKKTMLEDVCSSLKVMYFLFKQASSLPAAVDDSLQYLQYFMFDWYHSSALENEPYSVDEKWKDL